jgi:hypothetical protein
MRIEPNQPGWIEAKWGKGGKHALFTQSPSSFLPGLAGIKFTLLFEKCGAKICAIFESFVYRIAAAWTLSKLAKSRVLIPFTRFSEFFLCDECGNEAHRYIRGCRSSVRRMGSHLHT